MAVTNGLLNESLSNDTHKSFIYNYLYKDNLSKPRFRQEFRQASISLT